MKKRILVALMALGALVAVPTATSFAYPTNSDVTGVVTQDGKAVAGATVTVVCNNISQDATTDATGSYLATYSPASTCPAGSTVTVDAVKGALSGGSKGSMTPYGSADLNVAIVNVSVALPEFGLATGAIAGVAGVGAITVIRRRQLRGQTINK